MTSGLETLTEEWYAASQDVTIDRRLRVSGTVNLVLCSGATMTVNGGTFIMSDGLISGNMATLKNPTNWKVSYQLYDLRGIDMSMRTGNGRKRKAVMLAGLVICLFVSALFSAMKVFANQGSAQDIKLSDVFFVYPKSLQQEEPNIRGLNAAAENAILTMESDGEIWSLIQAAMTDPDEATVNRLRDMILGTDTRGEDCALSATEDLLSQIGSSAEIYEFAQWCTGPYQEFYKLAKTTKDVNKVVVDGAEYFVNLRYERVAGVVNALLADDDGIVRDVILSASEEHRDEILDAIDKGSEGFSDAMELLKTANRFTELVDTIVLLECVEDDMIDYLYSVVTTEDLKYSIDAYRNYKNGNYSRYVLDKWVKADVLEKITENFEDIILEIGVGTSGPSAAVMVYKITKVVLKYSGKLIGYLSGYGDADDLITAYKSWNYVQDLERVLSDLTVKSYMTQLSHTIPDVA